METTTITLLANLTNSTEDKVKPDAVMNYLLSTVVFFLMFGVGSILNLKLFRRLFHCAPPADEGPLPTRFPADDDGAQQKNQEDGQQTQQRNAAEDQEEEEEEEASPTIQMSNTSWRPLLACGIGVFCQIILTPCVGVAVAMSFDMSPWERFGCVAVSCVPGGAISNPIAHISGGVVELSVSMTVISSVLSFGMSPVNLLWTSYVVGVPSGSVDYASLSIGFAFMAVPLIVGVLVNAFASKRVKKVAGIVTAVGAALGVVAVIVIILGGFTPSITKNVVKSASWKVWVAASVVNFPVVAGLSYLFMVIAGYRPAICRTVAIESLQNVAIAYAVLQLGLRNASNDARTAAFGYGTIYSLAQYVWMFVIVIGFRCHKKYNEAHGIEEVDPEFGLTPFEEEEEEGDVETDNAAAATAAGGAGGRAVSAISLVTAPGESDAILASGSGDRGYGSGALADPASSGSA